jgi:hypothetical protein
MVQHNLSDLCGESKVSTHFTLTIHWQTTVSHNPLNRRHERNRERLLHAGHPREERIAQSDSRRPYEIHSRSVFPLHE